MILALLFALPWILACAAIALRVRPPPPLPAAPSSRLSSPIEPGPQKGMREEADSRPLLSVVVPARNEEDVIGRCIGSLVGSSYPHFEVIVVDDRSGDRTGEIARAVDPGRARRLVVLEGEALPDGWLGKPWACWQGYRRARGELLLFVDADTRHGPELLERAVQALEDAEAEGLSAAGRQVMEHWWEKTVLPQVFTLISIRFPDTGRPIEPGRCDDAVASGQFILVRRGAYEAAGGHRAVRAEVVEDLQLARSLCRTGSRLVLRDAGDALETRMYRSFGQMIEGWTKNLAIGTLQTLPPRARWWALPAGFLLGLVLWLVPPVVLAAGLSDRMPAAATLWAGMVSGVSALFWGAASARMGVSPLYGLLYPVGSALTSAIFARSVFRGGRVEWKGRTYRLDEGELKEGRWSD